jgi:nicotinic acid mononucleotide adenylyltransferase
VPCRLAVAIAGGGGHFLSTLGSTPGASSTLLEGAVLYDRESFHAYLDRYRHASSSSMIHHQASSSSFLSSPSSSSFAAASDHGSEWSAYSNRNNNSNNNSGTSRFQYASLSAAERLSEAALQQACQLSAAGVATAALRRSQTSSGARSLEDRNLLHRHLAGAVGVGCSSALQTTPTTTTNSRNSNSSSSSTATLQHSISSTNISSAPLPTRESRAHVVVQRSDGRFVYKLSMALRNSVAAGAAMKDHGTGRGDSESEARHRRRARFLEDVAVSHGILSCIERANADTAAVPAPMEEHHEGRGDVQVDFVACPTPAHAPALEDSGEIPGGLEGVVHEAVHRVLSHQHPVVALVPEYHNLDSSISGASRISFSLLSHFALPPSSVVFPGSFNPIHEGHVRLAKAAMDEVPQPRNVVWFEMSLTNADKPSLSSEDVSRRVQRFVDSFSGELEALVDFHWGILLSNAPLFRQKVDVLQPLLVHAGASSNAALDVIIGTDTLVRLVDPRYYQGSTDTMIQAIESMAARFVVGGRVIQSTSAAAERTMKKSASYTTFVAGVDDVARLPEQLQSRFVLLPEETFRVDISSTEIRRKLQAAESFSGEDERSR